MHTKVDLEAARAGRVAAALAAGLAIAGCSYAAFSVPQAFHPNMRAVCAAARFRLVVGATQSTETMAKRPDIWRDFKKAIEATGRLQIVPGDPPGMRAIGICGSCDDRTWAMQCAQEASAGAVLCFEVRAESGSEEVRVVSYVKLADASGGLIWQERAESSRRASGAENLQGGPQLVTELALSNNAKLAALLRAIPAGTK